MSTICFHSLRKQAAVINNNKDNTNNHHNNNCSHQVVNTLANPSLNLTYIVITIQKRYFVPILWMRKLFIGAA